MAYDAFLWLDGIPGEATRQGYEKWIQVEGFTWGAANHHAVGPGAGGMATGRADLTSFTVTKITDSSSPILFESCCTGKHLKVAKVVLNKAGEKSLKFLSYDFKNVFIDAVNWGGSAHGDERPTEQVSFAFGQVEISYTPQTETGAAGSPIRGSYDVMKGTK